MYNILPLLQLFPRKLKYFLLIDFPWCTAFTGELLEWVHMTDFDAKLHAVSASKSDFILPPIPIEWEIRCVVHIVNYAADYSRHRKKEQTCHLFDAESTRIPRQTAETQISPTEMGLICAATFKKPCLKTVRFLRCFSTLKISAWKNSHVYPPLG